MKAFWAKVRDVWWAYQRNMDINMLWPACKKQAPDIDHAKAAFAIHVFKDDCWIKYYGKEKLIDFVDTLE